MRLFTYLRAGSCVAAIAACSFGTAASAQGVSSPSKGTGQVEPTPLHPTDTPAASAEQPAPGQVSVAQPPASGTPSSDTGPDIVVTGTLIKGTGLNTPLPVAVIGAADIQRRGAPSTTELIKTLPISGAVLGDSNTFSPAANRVVGVGTLNLRGLGSLRTLVLLNGRRIVPTPGQFSPGVDTNLLPVSAIGRIEILKDGAAATYGSDAIAGVANFITRTDLNGFDAGGDYRFVKGSSGDYTASLAWGWRGDNGNILLTAGYQRRSRLPVVERDWATPSYFTNSPSWSLSGTPGTFRVFGPGNAVLAPAVQDANCSALGGASTFTGALSACAYPFEPNINLIEDEKRLQLYGEANADLGGSVRLHVEGLYSQSNLPRIGYAAAFAPVQGPNGPGSSLTFSIPSSNPGFNTFLTQTGNAGLIGRATSAGNLLYRPLAQGGNPFGNPQGGNTGQKKYDLFRFSGGLSGDIFSGNIHFDTAVTYSEETNRSNGPTDILITRLQAALNGFGGANCTGTVAGANGCLYFNPFSNAQAGNPALGTTNPGYVATTANSADVLRYLFSPLQQESTQSLLVADAVLSGKTGITLPGGDISFAVGGQYRHERLRETILNPLQDARINPCPIPGDQSCRIQTGVFIFQAPSVPINDSGSIKAVFAELNIPVFDRLVVQSAVRYEDYGGLTGSTVDPKVAAKLTLTDAISLRASWNSSFRGPSLVNRSASFTTGLGAIVAASNQFRAIDIAGNPGVGPENATSYNIGAIFDNRRIRFSVDYFNFKVKNQIVQVPANTIASAVVPTTAGLANCSSPLRSLITFDNNNTCTQGVTSGLNIARIRSDTVNGPTISTSGLDFAFDVRVPDLSGVNVSFGANASYVLKYDQAAFLFQPAGVSSPIVVTPAYSAVGFLNLDRLPQSMPRWRANGFIDLETGRHNLRFDLFYTDGVKEDRAPVYVQTAPVTTACATLPTQAGCQKITYGDPVQSFTQLDVTYRVRVFEGTTLFGQVANVFDTRPPAARTALAYDPFIGNPYERTFKLGFRQTF